MPGITEMATTFNVPNYVGELFAASPEDTPLLSSIGGLTGGDQANATLFTWQGYDLRDAEDTRQRVEGADAPSAEERTRYNEFNVVEVHQEAVSVSYTKQSATGQYGPTGGNTQQASVQGSSPVTDELTWQINQQLKQVARDIEKSFITGTFANPADNSLPRKTRGLLEAITTNAIVVDSDEATAGSQAGDLTAPLVLNLMQMVWESGGIQESETRTLITNATQKRNLTKLFVSDKNYQERTRNVGGVSLTTIETDFGLLNLMLDRYMPNDTIVVSSLEQLSPVFLPVPNKGFLFAEPLAKSGASEKYQIYGEVGLRYGNEKAHGKITNLNTAVLA